MYEIYANNTLIFSDVTPLESYKVINPKLTLEDSAAGSLEFTLPPGNVGYNSITCLTTECVVKKEGTEIWRGRVISETIDFWKNKRYMCEGELAYLVDTIQPPASYSASNTTIYSFLNSLLSKHNSQVNGATNPYVKTFTIGSVTVEDGDQQVDDDAINRFTNFETTLECINDKLVDRLGGHLRIRHVGNTRYLDYLADAYVGVCEQEIVFGSNLLDYVSDLSSVDWVSVVIPKGARLDREESSQPVAGLEEYLTGKYSDINDTWHSNASIYVKNPTAVSTYGYICATVEFSNIGDGIDLTAPDAAAKLKASANNLVNKAKRYLQELQTNRFNKVSLTVSAVDLHYLNPSIESLDLMEKVRCTSEPHGMINVEFPVTKIELDLLNPSNTVYTLGTDYNRTLTNAANRSDTNLSNYISETYTPVESAVLNGAKKNATNLIEGSAKGGVASWLYKLEADPTDYNNNNSIIDQDIDANGQGMKPIGIRIADQLTDKAANNRWLWTTGGLGHYTKNSTTHKWNPVNIGITMDGRIVADMITTGCIKLTGAANIDSWSPTGVKKTFLRVYDGNGTVIGRWGSDGIMIDGSTAPASITVKKDNDHMFSVSSTDGIVNCKGAVINGGSITVKKDDTHMFSVSASDGIVNCKGAVIEGDITATTGHIGEWDIQDGKLSSIVNDARAGLTHNHLGCGRSGYGLVNLRGATRRNADGGAEEEINDGDQEDWSTDRKYGFIQISVGGSPDMCSDGIRIFGNGHIVWYDDEGEAYRDVYLSQIGE